MAPPPAAAAAPLVTTVVGSFPKPGYVEMPDWFRSGGTTYTTAELDAYEAGLTPEARGERAALLEKAVQDCLECQSRCGVDVVTDGEMCRENYVHHLCRSIQGIDFTTLTEISVRTPAYKNRMPTITGPVRPPLTPVSLEEFRRAVRIHGGTRDLKFTLPGPMTIMDSVASTECAHYKDRKLLAEDLAAVVNAEVLALVAAGAEHVQVDEPLFCRKPEDALAFGIPALDLCFAGTPKSVERTVHACCGYPDHLDQEDYIKADPTVLLKLAAALDASAAFDVLSIEDAHCHNDLADLLPRFQRKKVCLGCVAIAKSRVESPEEIAARLREALRYIPAERLQVAPDCGLGFLPRDVLERKLTNMASAARAATAAEGD